MSIDGFFRLHATTIRSIRIKHKLYNPSNSST